MVYILLAPGFEEAEALVPADLLRRADLPVTLLGANGRTITGSHGINVIADLPMEAAMPVPGDMLVIPGGLKGVSFLEKSPTCMRLIRQAVEQPDIWVAAICAAPAMLARAGLIPQGYPAVCYPGMESFLSAAGANPVMEQSVVCKGKLVTARAAGSSFDFGLALIEILAGTDTADRVRNAVHYGQ